MCLSAAVDKFPERAEPDVQIGEPGGGSAVVAA